MIFYTKAQLFIPVIGYGDEKYVLKQYEKQAKVDKEPYKRIYETFNTYENEEGKSADFYNKGCTALKHKEYPKAIYYYNKAIDANSKDADVYCNRSMAKLNMEKYAEAIEVYSPEKS